MDDVLAVEGCYVISRLKATLSSIIDKLVILTTNSSPDAKIKLFGLMYKLSKNSLGLITLSGMLFILWFDK